MGSGSGLGLGLGLAATARVTWPKTTCLPLRCGVALKVRVRVVRVRVVRVRVVRVRVRAVEVRRRLEGDEELGPVRVGPVVGHAQPPDPVVPQPEALVLEGAAEDRVASVAALRHEAWDDAVELGALEGQGSSVPPGRVARGEANKVADRLWHSVAKHAENQPPGRLAVDREVHEHALRHLRLRSRQGRVGSEEDARRTKQG